MNEFSSDHIRVNLSAIAQKVLNNDRIIFSASSNSRLSFGTLVNRIIENFDDDFEINEDYVHLRGEGQVVYLQSENINTLDSVRLSHYLKNVPNPTVPKYVKCLLESFARLPFIEQERLILKKDIIEEIEKALNDKDKKRLRLKFKGKYMELTPVCIAPALEGTFQYLIGVKDDETISIRLSRIEKIKAIGKADKIKQALKDNINVGLYEFGPTFIVEKPVDVKVRFTTQDGLNSYLYSVMHRPMHYAIEEGNIYKFRCSELQARYFFFRFAGEVEILEPESLRDKFHDLYQAGLKNYQ